MKAVVFSVYRELAHVDDMFSPNRKYDWFPSEPFTESFAIPSAWYKTRGPDRDIDLRRDPHIPESGDIPNIHARRHSEFEYLSPGDRDGRRLYPCQAGWVSTLKSNKAIRLARADDRVFHLESAAAVSTLEQPPRTRPNLAMVSNLSVHLRRRPIKNDEGFVAPWP
ncbi:hypothetical protein A5678_04505 [Mycobacterium sp. E2733]|nr:hypothetical protein A5678_04505 [Mycobacterium sp. E2733]